MGRDITALIITVNASSPGSRDRPSVKMVANIHGDEPSGRHLLLLLAEHLCAGYPWDETVTKLLENIQLWLLPTINPDGFEMRLRGNSLDVDLNRNFPDPVRQHGSDLRLSTPSQQPETVALMGLMLKHRFVASLSLHEGALLANYPWDGYEDGSVQVTHHKHASPDDATFVHLARSYASLHTTMSHSQEFTNGITNGAAWYPVYGEITLELNDDKWPNMTRLRGMWEENKEAMVSWPLAAVMGVEAAGPAQDPTGLALNAEAEVLQARCVVVEAI
ncbi:MAG: hypothetical protein WDW38_001806 [Sanguina aurantia]